MPAFGNVYSPHMPRCAAPQAPHGPGSADADALDAPATANTESNCSTFLLPHRLQTVLTDEEFTMTSNFSPHSLQRYSKIGMLSSLFEYIGSTAGLQFLSGQTGRGLESRRIFSGFSPNRSKKMA